MAPRGCRDREVKKKWKGKKAREASVRERARAREIERHGDTRRWVRKKEEQGFSIDVIVSVRHPSHSSFLRAFAPARRKSLPPPPPCLGVLPRPKTTPYNGVPAIQATFSSLLCFSSRVLPHIDYNITTYPSFRLATHPFFGAHLSLFFAATDAAAARRARPLIYTRTSDHNINFNDGRDENIRTPRYLWRLSWPPSTSF